VNKLVSIAILGGIFYGGWYFGKKSCAGAGR
jgi:hypothetical protein